MCCLPGARSRFWPRAAKQELYSSPFSYCQLSHPESVHCFRPTQYIASLWDRVQVNGFQMIPDNVQGSLITFIYKIPKEDKIHMSERNREQKLSYDFRILTAKFLCCFGETERACT